MWTVIEWTGPEGERELKQRRFNRYDVADGYRQRLNDRGAPVVALVKTRSVATFLR